MRGLAALGAAVGTWIAVTGKVPALRVPHLRLPSLRVAAAGLVAGLAAGLLALGALSVPAAALALAALATAAPPIMAETRRRATRERLADQWPDFIALLRARIAAGATLPDAFLAAAERTPALLPHLPELERDIRFGEGFVAGLERLRVELADATADRVLITCASAHRTGGPRVAAIMSALGGSVADELRLRKAHHAALTEQRLTALVALLAPWGLLALTVATNPQSAEAFRSPGGVTVIGIGFAATVVGHAAARRTAALTAAPRLFR